MRKLFCLCLLLVLSSNIFADQFFTGNSMFNTYTARTLQLGTAQISTQGRVYRKAEVFGDKHLVNATGVAGFNFGFTNNLEVGGNVTFYQDQQRNLSPAGEDEILFNTPDAIYLRLKYRGNGWEIGNRYFGLWAIASSARYLAKGGNVVLEPYSARSIQGNITGIFSFYFDQIYMEEGQSAHLNLGYILHNNSSTAEVVNGLLEGAMEFTYAIGYKYPINYFDLNLELSGNSVFNLPKGDKAIHYSTEPYIYITPSVKYKAFAGMDFDLGCDILAYTTYSSCQASYKDGKAGAEYYDNSSVPYYAPWRALVRINYTPSTPYVDIPTFSSASSVKNRINNSRQISSRRELFEWLIEEPDRVEYIDMKLDKLRNERKTVEENINKIKAGMDEGSTP